MTRIVRAVGLIVLVLAVPLLAFTSSVRFVVNDLWLYHVRLVKYDVPHTTGITLEELDQVDGKLVQYFKSNEEYIRTVLSTGVPVYNEKEIVHLKDVKDLVQFDYWLQWLTLAYVLGYVLAVLVWKQSEWRSALSTIGRALEYGGGLALSLMAILGLAMLVAFDRMFLAFHLVGFKNLLWVLNPATDRLIQMFPEGFFFDAALFLAGVTLVVALMIGAVGWVLSRYGKGLAGHA